MAGEGFKMRDVESPKNPLGASKWIYSTGVNDLDQLLGGGIEKQSVYMIKNDRYAQYGRLLLDMFISVGIHGNDNIYIVSMDLDWKDILKNSIRASVDTTDGTRSEEDAPALKIAWRYGNSRRKIQSVKSDNITFNLSSRISSDTLQATKDRVGGIGFKEIENLPEDLRIDEILTSIQNALGEWSSLDNGYNYRKTRICIDNLGEPRWPGWSNFLKGDSTHITKFLWGLQSILRMYPFACACVTIPCQYYTDEELSNLLYFSSSAIRISSFLDDYAEHCSGYSKICDGFIITEQGRKTGWESLGFKVHNKGMSIKTLTIPPEDFPKASRVASHASSTKELF